MWTCLELRFVVFACCVCCCFELFQTFVQGGVLKYTSQFLTSCDDHANLCWLKDLLTCGRKDLLAFCSSGTLRCTCVVVSEDLSYFFSIYVCMYLYLHTCVHTYICLSICLHTYERGGERKSERERERERESDQSSHRATEHASKRPTWA